MPSPDLADRLDARLDDRGDDAGWRVLRALDELLPIGACPALLLVSQPDEVAEANAHLPQPESLENAARLLGQLVRTVPTWPAGMTLTPEEIDFFKRTAAESQTKTLVITGTIPLQPESHRLGSRAAPRIENNGEDVEQLSPGVDPTLLAADPKTAQAQALAHAAASDAARSHAERLLFQMLEGHPATQGRFVQNGSPGFKFGRRPAEVDLLASGLRLAVEIDGYYHFTNPDSYRRDRQKDWLLQSHGYTVVRVLAEDVAARMEKVLDFLVSVVENCREGAP